MAKESGTEGFGSKMKRLMAQRVEARKRRAGDSEHPGPLGDAPGPPGPVPLGLLAALSPQLPGHPPTALAGSKNWTTKFWVLGPLGGGDAPGKPSLVAEVARKVG